MLQEYFLIKGKKPLKGEIEVRGSKNSCLPLICLSLLSEKPSFLENIPLIKDVFCLFEILKKMGVKIEISERKAKIVPQELHLSKIDKDLITRFRGSILLLGALLSRFKKIFLPYPGGCLIGKRPLTAHFEGFRQLGVKIKEKKCGFEAVFEKIKSRKVILPEFSVTATENLMIFLAKKEGKFLIETAAYEPQVQETAEVLNQMGAKIRFLPFHKIEIQGKKNLNPFFWKLKPDPLEAGSFILMAAATKSRLKIKNVPFEHLTLTLKTLEKFGVKFKKEKENLLVLPPRKLKSPSKTQVMIYPGVPSDLQTLFGVLCTQSEGKTLIHDPLYENRLRYLEEIKKMGAKIKILNRHEAEIEGPSKLKGKVFRSFDLRSGMAFIVAALIAEGESRIYDTYQVDRGYEKIEKRLQKVGAFIRRIKK